jgi:hypothetical protein
MPSLDRAFRVIVLGGIALAAVPASACGGAISASKVDGGTDAESFPDEGAPDTGFPNEGARDAGFPTEGFDTSFPSETGQMIDSGVAPDAFPTEGPAMILDSGSGEGAVDGFPQETAQAGDP